MESSQILRLKQKQGYLRREFELTSDTLEIKTKSLGENKEWSVKLEHLGFTKYYHYYSKAGQYIVGTLLSLIVVVAIIAYLGDEDLGENIGALIFSFLVFGGLALLAFIAPNKKELNLIGGEIQASFLLDSPTRDDVENFVDEVIKRSKSILLRKYAKVDVDLPEETQMNQLNWLRNRDLIDEELYEQLKKEYKTQRIIKDF